MSAAAGPAAEFVHLHVASGFSMRYGTSTPEALVERAAQHRQPVLALTDRDGLYGAVRFVQAATAAGIAPVLGVDLAVGPDAPGDHGGAGEGRRDPAAYSSRSASSSAQQPLQQPPQQPSRPPRTPARGGADRDPRHPRVTVLARGRAGGVPAGVGWAALCRLVTETHLRGERGVPVTSAAVVAAGCWRGGDPRSSRDHASPLLVLLGPDSDVGRALLVKRVDRARVLLDAWRRRLPAGAVAIEVVCHGGPEGTPASRSHARRLLGLADEQGVPAVLTAAVRHVDPGESAVVDLLDAARRLVALDTRHLDRVTDAAHLAATPTMHAVALEVTGGDRGRADELLQRTLAVGLSCAQSARHDLGIGSVHLPEPHTLKIEPGESPQARLEQRCRAAVGGRYPGIGEKEFAAVERRLTEELKVIAELGYPTYFLTVAEVVDLIREMGVRVAARGSGAGSLVNYLLGISGVDPIRYNLLMERFCSPLRAELPDIDIDVESARRTEVYERILDRFGGERVTCVSMMDTYKVRHAIRDVGAALGLPPTEIDEIAKAFPHIRARDARSAIAELPELRSRGLDSPRMRVLFDLVERLDGLPRHIALHPCGVVLSDGGLLDRTPVEASWLGFPMSQFDKDDVEALGLLKLDVLGIRMQSAMAHALQEVQRVDAVEVDLDDQRQVPLDDEATFRLIRTSHTLGCFQIESPGQRELIGKFGPERFEDLVIDISLFRPGPVKSDMITPFLEARHGWKEPSYLHPTLIEALRETEGVVVFHEQVLMIVAETTGVSLAQADEVRRTLGTPRGQVEIEAWWRPAALARGYDPADVDRIWEVLKAFASFGFCKAHAAAFALPTYHSAWLKTHHPAAFLSGVLTHDPGMYPKRLILDDARSLGIAVLGLDVNASTGAYRVERLDDLATDVQVQDFDEPSVAFEGVGHGSFDPERPDPDLPDARGYGIRLSLSDVRGISDAEVARIVAGQPYAGLADFWHRAHVSRPVAERLVLAGGFDALYGMGSLGGPGGVPRAGGGGAWGGGGGAVGSRGMGSGGLGRRGRTTRRDLLLHVAELDRYGRALDRSAKRAAPRRGRGTRGIPVGGRSPEAGVSDGSGVRALAAGQSQAALPVTAAAEQPTQLTLDLGDRPELTSGTGLPELTGPERVRAELDILGLDASAHVVDFYAPLLEALGVTRSRDLLRSRSRSTVWVCGVKVATQTPPIRSGRRVVFLTLDDSTGPVDATFFEDVQGPYAATVFHSWMMLVRGVVRRTGPRGISLRATGAWELTPLWEAWTRGGIEAVHAAMEDSERSATEQAEAAEEVQRAAGPAGRRVLVHASGFKQSPYADIKPAGGDVRGSRALAQGAEVPDDTGLGQLAAPRKLWHSSPGSSGH
ncbi:DNA polymerase III subunit alpha [Phycicoccus sp. Root101]|uniref:DNA polymerase III subunit alpha n=1 Tax=Phycicoccus sp. Root101 TaxID=1736421 RepID=UPI000702804C|nr:DNA polymerase III subunit alpha [Phycicoccus sp. Root101]KQU70309.1 DNA polymerase III subunit alpha [Phycicoccus sp. Root101]